MRVRTVLDIADLVQVVDGLGAAARIGIDGPGASGKSTLAAGLAEALPNAVLVEGDGFYRPESDAVRSSPQLMAYSIFRDSLLRSCSLIQRVKKSAISASTGIPEFLAVGLAGLVARRSLLTASIQLMKRYGTCMT